MVQSVTCQESAASFRRTRSSISSIPQREGKHAVEMLDAVLSPFFIAVNDNFSITECVKAMATSLELQAQLPKIIDLAIQDNAEVARFVVNGLMASREINDAEAAHAKNCAVTGKHTFGVRPAIETDPQFNVLLAAGFGGTE